MDFAEAHRRGKEGEKLVSRELRKLSRRHPIWPINDVLLDLRDKTAQIDHVVVDRRGILVVETKRRQGALLKGKQSERQWTACYPGHRNESFQNPLAQNDAHVAALRHVLRASGIDLPEEAFTNAVVFVGAKTSALELDADPSTVVLDLGALTGLVVSRQRAPSDRPQIPPELAMRIIAAIQAVNRSADPEVVARHDAQVAGRRETVSARASSARLPTRRYVPAMGRARPPAAEGNLAALAVGIAIVLLVLVGGGMSWIGGPLRTLFSPGGLSNPVGQRGATAGDAANVERAKQILRDSDPRTYAKVTDLDSPAIGTARGIPTYTWQYTEKLSADKVRVRSLTMAIDASGVLRGVTRE